MHTLEYVVQSYSVHVAGESKVPSHFLVKHCHESCEGATMHARKLAVLYPCRNC